MKINALSTFIAIGILYLISCKKDTTPFTATITGEDPRTCMCCGGYWVQITIENAPTYHQVFEEKKGFISDVSVLDLMFNEGTVAGEYLKS